MAATITTTPDRLSFAGNPIWIAASSDLVIPNNKALITVTVYEADDVAYTTHTHVLDFDSDSALTFNIGPLLNKALFKWRQFAPFKTGAADVMAAQKMLCRYEVAVLDDFVGESGAEDNTTGLFAVKGSIVWPMFEVLDYLNNYNDFGNLPILTWGGAKHVVPGAPEYIAILMDISAYNESHALQYPGVKYEAFDINGDSLGVAVLGTIDVDPLRDIELLVGKTYPQSIIDDHPTTAHYDVWFVDTETDDRLSQKRRFVIDGASYYQTRHFVFFNSLSGWDTVTLHGGAEQGLPVSRTGYETSPMIDSQAADHFVHDINEGRSAFKISGQCLSRYSRTYMQDLFLSNQVFEYRSGLFIPIRITSNKLKIVNDGDTVHSVEFEYEYAFNVTGFTPLP